MEAQDKVRLAVAGARKGSLIRSPSPLLVTLTVWALFVVINPVGYVGGGWDDTHYLAAARCWAKWGPCLPVDHWWRRFPLVAPAGLTITLFGLSRQTLWIVPAVYSAAAVILLTIIVQRQFGRMAGLLAGTTFVLTPAVGRRVLDLGIDLPEAALIFAAVASLQRAYFSKARSLFALSGMLLALAVQCRPTVLAALPIFCIGVLLIDRRGLAHFLIGFLIPILLETIAYQWAAGDPLLSWKLSLAHTRIPSSELSGVDLSRSPLLNTQFIQAWRPVSGISTHWLIQGPLNLLLSRQIGITLYLSLALLALNVRKIGTGVAGEPVLLFVVIGAALYFLALNYVFAIDPTPRMFLPVLAAACAVIGVLAPLAWHGPQKIVVLLFFGVIAGSALIVPFERPKPHQPIAFLIDGPTRKASICADQLARDQMDVRYNSGTCRGELPGSPDDRCFTNSSLDTAGQTQTVSLFQAYRGAGPSSGIHRRSCLRWSRPDIRT